MRTHVIQSLQLQQLLAAWLSLQQLQLRQAFLNFYFSDS